MPCIYSRFQSCVFECAPGHDPGQARVIAHVHAGSPAHNAGLQQGDRIVSVSAIQAARARFEEGLGKEAADVDARSEVSTCVSVCLCVCVCVCVCVCIKSERRQHTTTHEHKDVLSLSLSLSLSLNICMHAFVNELRLNCTR